MVRQLRALGPNGRPPTLLDALASVRDPSGTPLTDDEIASYAAYGIGASIGDVGRLASFLLYEILHDQGLRGQIVAEAQAAFASGLGGAGRRRRDTGAGRTGFERLLAESGGPRGELARAMLARVERLPG
jgi:cytochrome P450